MLGTVLSSVQQKTNQEPNEEKFLPYWVLFPRTRKLMFHILRKCCEKCKFHLQREGNPLRTVEDAKTHRTTA